MGRDYFLPPWMFFNIFFLVLQRGKHCLPKRIGRFRLLLKYYNLAKTEKAKEQ